MKLSIISKSLLVALPMLALGACSSNSSSDTDATSSETETSSTQPAATTNDSVQTDTIDAVGDTDSETVVNNAVDAVLEPLVYFDFDRSTIKSEFASNLDAHAAYLVANPSASVTLEGHSDEKGTPEYNIALGERRGVAVATYLESMGASADQIKVVSYGEEKPVNTAHNEAAWSENRRVELVY